ncbi:hypothetical protein BJY52DRAFT_1088348, partial [Lactarius psammicola]
WPGYKEFKRQIPTREPTSVHNPIDMARFARQIGRTVDAFLQVRLPMPPHEENGSDIIIIGVVHVSAGSWMPVMQ